MNGIRGLVIDTHNDGYDFEQCGSTMTVSRLIDILSGYPSDMPVYVGNNRDGWYNGEPSWYSYGAINSDNLIERYEAPEEDDDELDDIEEEAEG